MRRFLLIVPAAVVVLAGCGAVHPKPLTGDAALAKKIHDLGGDTGFPEVSCVSRTCTVTWNERVHDTHEGWLIARTRIAELEDGFWPLRHYTLRIRDRHTQRLWSWACSVPKHPDRPNLTDAKWPYDECALTTHRLT